MKKLDRVLLVDGDMVAYRNAAALEEKATESIDWGEGVESTGASMAHEWGHRRMSGFLERLKVTLEADEAIVCLSSDTSFRRDLAPSYKLNRCDKQRPKMLEEFKDYLRQVHHALTMKSLEADDIMGILATGGAWGETVIVTIDKDLRQIPGLIYNPFNQKSAPALETITKDQADRFFFFQTLVGDEIDGYKGCRGIGPVAANTLLDRAAADEEGKGGTLVERWWAVVLATFLSKGMTEEDALTNARMARILRHEDWTPEQGVKLWTPQSPSLPNTGPMPIALLPSGPTGNAHS